MPLWSVTALLTIIIGTLLGSGTGTLPPSPDKGTPRHQPAALAIRGTRGESLWRQHARLAQNKNKID